MKKVILIITIIIVVGLAAGIVYFWQTHKNMKYTDWTIVQEQFQSCRIASVDQTHGRLVNLILKDGSREYVLEPKKDYIIDELVNALNKCGQIDLKTK